MVKCETHDADVYEHAGLVITKRQRLLMARKWMHPHPVTGTDIQTLCIVCTDAGGYDGVPARLPAAGRAEVCAGVHQPHGGG